ncbi:MAG: serine/threonine-protein kinase [Acidobacteria bacterium]|nr:serine/threonine-protein kinase [Acidobacteriota bacterium]
MLLDMMSPERWRQVESLYNAAIEKNPANRAAFVAQASEGDDELRREVESLLAQNVSATGRLDRPVWQDDELPSTMIATAHLSTGTQLGPYRIEGMLGAGGMGQVYRARDTRLDRTVAVKVVNEKFSDRFQREARAISSLNHPNICTLYDVGPDYLVMELLDGETLSSRLEGGPLPLDLATRYGVQVADALAAAHAKGIIHRDLKPGNIMVTKSLAKVLDFGLAKLSGDPQLSASHAVMGTPAYMAPEQWKGSPCSERTDIFALGLVLYEMATGKRVEPTDEIDAMEGLPPQFAHVVKRCLAHDPEDRWQAARDVKAELEWAAKSPTTAQAPAGKSSRRLAGAVGVLGVSAIAGAFLLGRGWVGPAEQVYISSIPLALGTSLHQYAASRLALSPDGRYLAIAAGGRLLLRSLDEDSAQPLAGTEGAGTPFWSPDGSQIGFFAGNELRRVNRSGGPAITLARTDGSGGGSWNRDGVILFASYSSALQRVSALGGAPVSATTLDRETGQSYHSRPFFLPDGHHFVYTAQGTKTGGPFDANGIYASSLSSNRSKLILAGASHAQYAQGYLLFLRQQALMAQQFDVSRLELKGEAVVVAREIETDLPTGNQQGAFSVSQTGALVYQAGQPLPASQLFWFDRSGKQLGTLGEKSSYSIYSIPQISPDGERVAVIVDDPINGTDIWIFDVARGARTRLTSGARLARGPIWSSDGSRILFRAARGGRSDLYQKATNQPGAEELLWTDNLSKHPTSWSQDGRFILYGTGVSTPETGPDLWVLPLKDRKAFPFLKTTFAERIPRFSPDGRWVTYSSNESGRFELFVAPFPGPGPKSRISEGLDHDWREDGREIFYTKRGKMMAVSVDGRGRSFEIGAEKPLFDMPRRAARWDATADGKKFLINVVAEESTEEPSIALVVNWPMLLSRPR